MVYDSGHHRMLLYGGYPSHRDDVYALSLSGPRVWTRIPVVGPKPPARAGGSLIYDPIRDRLILFAGEEYLVGFRSDIWALPLSGVPTWQQLLPSGGPGLRAWHSAIYDPVRDRMVVFGGLDNTGNPGSSTWALSLSGPVGWQPVQVTNSVAARLAHHASYDAGADRMIVHGGSHNSGSLNETISLDFGAAPGDPNTWSNLTPPPAQGPSPSTRYGSGVAWVSSRRQLVLFGGGDAQTQFSDAWLLVVDPIPAWTQLSPGPGITSRASMAAAHDPIADKLIVFGGWSGSGPQSDTWDLPLSPVGAWALVPANPRGGYDPAMVLDVAGSRAIMWEGFGTWQLSLGQEPTWAPILLTEPKPPTGATTIFDPVRNRMLIFGNTVFHKLDLAAPTNWSVLTTTGSPPVWDLAVAVYDPVRDRAVVWDGSAAKGVWQLSLNGTPAWTQIPTSGTGPSYRLRPRTLYDPVLDRLLVCGGVGVIDAWQLNLGGTPTWSPLAPQGTTPPPRADASCVLDGTRNRVLLFGGGLPGIDVLTLGATPAWTTLAPAGSEAPLASTTLMGAVYDAARDRVITYGGIDGTVHQNSAFELAFAGAVDVPGPVPQPGTLSFTRASPDPAVGIQRMEWTRPAGEGASLEIFSVAGRRVWSSALPATATQATWNGRDAQRQPVAPGVYFARLRGVHGVAMRRLVRLR